MRIQHLTQNKIAVVLWRLSSSYNSFLAVLPASCLLETVKDTETDHLSLREPGHRAQ